MTKSLTINIGGQLFEIEATAYEQLRNYIDSLENHFKNDPDGKEIVEDLEMRIAELFTELQTTEYKIILKEQVEFVKLRMGTVDEFEPIDEAYIDQEETKKTSSEAKTQIIKKLMRDPDDRVLGGVCAGLGHYFNLNPVIIRIVLLILFFGLGFGLLIYLLLWMVIPKAISTTDKLMMRGQPINLNTVADSIKEENLRQSGQSGFINFIGQLIHYLGGFLFAIGKVLLIIASIVLLLVAVIGIILVGFGLLKGGVLTQSLAVSSAPLFWLMKLMAIIAFGVPLLLLIIGLIYLLLNRNYFKSSFALPLLGVWLISIFSLATYTKRIANDFKEESTVKEVFELATFPGDTVYVGILQSDIETFTIGNKNQFAITHESLWKVKDSLYINQVELDIKPSSDHQFRLIVEKEAKGKNKRQAADRAIQTNYVWKQDSDHLLFHSFLGVQKNTKWRMQKVALTLQVPENKYIHLGKDMDWVLEDVDNLQEMYDDEMPDKLWKMTAKGLTCVSCDIEAETTPKDKKQKPAKLYMSEDAFHTIDLQGSFEVTIEQSNTPQVLFNGKENIPDHVDLIRNSNKKKISIETKKSIKKTNILIRTPQLNLLNYSGAGKLKIADFKGDDVEINLEGAIASIIAINCNQLELNLDGVSSHQLLGKSSHFIAAVNGVNSINARRFKTNTANINIEGTNTASFWVSDEMDIRLEGLNAVNYRGEPNIEKDISITSNLKKE